MPASSGPEPFEARLTVDKSIVELLSKSTYQRNFAYALREMVSNAYDADATKVEITIDRAASNIVIHDTGNGMGLDDFKYYLRIAGKRRGKKPTSKFNRQRIGQFGVGFLSVFPFCKIIKIVTTTEGSDEILSAQIPAGQFFAKTGGTDVGDLPVTGTLYQDPKRRIEHFTTITLVGLTDAARIAISTTLPKESHRRSLGIRAWSPMERLKWELQDELPLPLPSESAYLKCFSYAESETMAVVLDGQALLRNDLKGDLLDHGEITVGQIRALYAISTPWKAIEPIQMRHMKLRLKNVGVGPRTDFNISLVRPYSRLAWLTGEVHIVSGLDDAISVSRDAFLVSAEIEALYEEVAAKLRRQAVYVESIEENRKTITKHVSKGKQKQVGATREVIDRSAKKLAERGFTIQKIRPIAASAVEPVQIDRAKKVVTIVENHPSFEDEITIGDRSFRLAFKDEHSPDGNPCMIRDDDTIIVFTKYPLFSSKRYGEVFERFCILTAVAKSRTRSSAEMHTFILEQLGTLFKDY